MHLGLMLKATKEALISTYLKAYETQEEDNLLLTTMVIKEDFNENSHVRSRKHYLPIAPNLITVAKESDLLTNLILIAEVSPGAATYQSCFLVPMLQFRSIPINDINLIIIKYWDNSVLLVNCGFLVAIKSPII